MPETPRGHCLSGHALPGGKRRADRSTAPKKSAAGTARRRTTQSRHSKPVSFACCARDAHCQNINLGVRAIPVMASRQKDGHNHSSRGARAAGLGPPSEGAASGLGPAPGSICAYATLFQLTSCEIKARSRLPRRVCQAIAWATRDMLLSGIIRAWPI